MNVVRVFTCQAPADDNIISGEKEEGFMCETPDKMFSAPGPCGGGLENEDCVLDWQVEDHLFFCDNGASCHVSRLSTGITNYGEANATMRTASGKRQCCAAASRGARARATTTRCAEPTTGS